MTQDGGLQRGRYGRMAVLRLRPNQDLVEGLEAACRDYGIGHGLVRSALGSLTDASFALGGEGGDEEEEAAFVAGPGLEIVSVAGDIRPDAERAPRVELSGSVADGEGRVHGGRFRRGANPICITMELVIQEWLPETR